MIKKIFSYIIYFFSALTACLFAFFLVLAFLNPALSSSASSPSSKKDLTFKKVFGDIFKNLKSITKESFLKKKEDKALEGPQEISIGKEEKEPKPPAPPPSVPPSPSVVPEGGEASPAVQKQMNPAPLSGDEQSSPAGKKQVNQASPSPSSSEALKNPNSLAKEGDLKVQIPSPSLTDSSTSSVLLPQEELGSSEVSAEIRSYMAPFIYESINQRDPFEDPTLQKEESESVLIIPRTPPEEYELEEIKLKGIIWDAREPKALFELPGDAGYYNLIKGDKVGKKGVIFEIRESEVVIVETNIIGAGSQKKEERTIKIKKIDRFGIKK